MQDDRANHTASNNYNYVKAEQHIVRTIGKYRYLMHYRFGKTLKSGMEKIDDIARS